MDLYTGGPKSNATYGLGYKSGTMLTGLSDGSASGLINY